MLSRKMLPLFVFSCFVLFGLVTQAYAEEGLLSVMNGSFSVSNPFVLPGQTFSVSQQIRNDGSQTLNDVSARFVLEWGIDQATNQINFQSATCTGALAGSTFAVGFSPEQNNYSTNPANFAP